MSSAVKVGFYEAPPLNEKELLRCLQAKELTEESKALLHECQKELFEKLTYKVCFKELSKEEARALSSHDLLPLIEKSQKIILFAATVGLEPDRLVRKYSRLSPAKAMMIEALGSERAESLCDLFANEQKEAGGFSHNPRFSPGYGDLPLETQKSIFSLLSCEKNIGVFLNESLLMTPKKSVTAFLGLY